MRNGIAVLLVLASLSLLLTTCSSTAQPGAPPTPAMAADLGLARKGLSPSEVDLPCAQADQNTQLKIVSCRVFRHMGQTVHLVGEVENTTSGPLGKVEVTAVGKSPQGEVMDTKSDQAYFDPVAPSKRTPFRVFFDARDVAKIELSVKGETSMAETPASMEVSNVTLSEPSSGYTHIRGEVNNPGADGTNAVFIAILRDEGGQVVEVHREVLLKPLATGSNKFDVLALHRGAKTADVVIRPQQ